MSKRMHLLMLLCSACLPDLVPDPGDPDALAPQVSSLDGAFVWSVDATDEEAWVGVDLIDGSVVPEGTGQLDMMRFNIRMSPGWEAAWVRSSDFNVAPPEDGWVIDMPDQDGDRLPEYALKDWYNYNFDTHEVTPKNRIWFLRPITDAPVFDEDGQEVVVDFDGMIRIRIDGYYDQAGTSAVLQLSSAIETP